MSPRAFSSIRGHHLYIPPLARESVVLDFGAAEGEFAREIVERFDATVHSVEANPRVFAKSYSHPRVTKHNLAITDYTGIARLYLSANPEGNSLDSRHRDVSGDDHIEVAATSFSDFLAANNIERIDVLKVDIEGAEIALFRSVDDATLRRIGQISIEFHDFIGGFTSLSEVDAIKARLGELGFCCFVYRRPNIDVLFLNRQLGMKPWRIWMHRCVAATVSRTPRLVKSLTKQLGRLRRFVGAS